VYEPQTCRHPSRSQHQSFYYSRLGLLEWHVHRSPSRACPFARRPHSDRAASFPTRCPEWQVTRRCQTNREDCVSEFSGAQMSGKSANTTRITSSWPTLPRAYVVSRRKTANSHWAREAFYWGFATGWAAPRQVKPRAKWLLT